MTLCVGPSTFPLGCGTEAWFCVDSEGVFDCRSPLYCVWPESERLAYDHQLRVEADTVDSVRDRRSKPI